MKLFTLRVEVSESDSTNDVAEKLERVAQSMRKQSECATFLEDASGGSGSLAYLDLHGTWSVEP